MRTGSRCGLATTNTRPDAFLPAHPKRVSCWRLKPNGHRLVRRLRIPGTGHAGGLRQAPACARMTSGADVLIAQHRRLRWARPAACPGRCGAAGYGSRRLARWRGTSRARRWCSSAGRGRPRWCSCPRRSRPGSAGCAAAGRAGGWAIMVSEASPSAAAASDSPSALMILARFSRSASAWRAMARCMLSGRRPRIHRR